MTEFNITEINEKISRESFFIDDLKKSNWPGYCWSG